MRAGRSFPSGSPLPGALIDAGNATMDKKKRRELLATAARLIGEDVPWAFACRPFAIYGASRRVDWHPRPDGLLLAYDMSFKK